MQTAKFCVLPARNLPVIATADVIVAGATVGAIAAALEAAKHGASVFVISTKPYMGEDMGGALHRLFEDWEGGHPLLDGLHQGERTPLRLKKQLEDTLIAHRIDFLYASFVTEVLCDEKGALGGVVIQNRGGQQIVRGKVILDGTLRADVAQMAGATPKFRRDTNQSAFQFITIGNQIHLDGQTKRLPYEAKGFPVCQHTFHLSPERWDFPALCAIEQEIRGRVWDAEQVDTADTLMFTPPYTIAGKQPQTASPEACQSAEVPQVFVLGRCADVSKAVEETFAQPKNLLFFAEEVGAAAAAFAAGQKPVFPAEAPHTERETAEGVIKIHTGAIRPSRSGETLLLGEKAVPVLAAYDVVVAGGGTAGAPAAISAARHGAKTLVLEYLHGLGGTQTMGRIGTYWDGFREGFTKEIDQGVAALAEAGHPRQETKDGRFVIDWKMEWYRREIRKAGGDIWFGAMVAGAFVNGEKVQGVLVATPEGLGVVLADIVIDATGSGDVAIAAGAGYAHTDESLFAVQGAGLPGIDLGANYANTDWTFNDDGDVFDITRLFIAGKTMFPGAFDVGKLPQTRERRRIAGDYTVSVLDVINNRRYADTISFHTSSFDTHGYTVDPYFTIAPPEKRHVLYDADVPLRSLLPQGLSHILVTGLGASAHRDAMPVIRMQPCLQNQGYSVGYVSALAVKEGCSPRQVDMKKVQQYLVSKGILPKRVLTDREGFAFTEEQWREAVVSLPKDFAGLQILLTDPNKAEALLLDAYEHAPEENRLAYGQALCMLGNKAGLPAVLQAVESFTAWDEGWDYTGMGQFGPCMSKLDSFIIALGETKDEAALPAVLEKASLLTNTDAFSHFRSVVLACESIGSSAAAPVLSKLLNEIDGRNAVTTYRQAQTGAIPDKVDVSLRNLALREIFLARGLYRCGDDGQKGEAVLRSYADDLHGHYFLHALGILNEDK